jgi:ATP-binding cassette subfamily B protein
LALCDLELTIEPGECVAVCGAAGSGKTSLLGLVPRFFDASRGRVLVHGLDVREQDLTALRRSIALVFQESFLFSHTVAQNLTFGQPGATQAQLEAAARAARAHDFIAALPEGYDTLLGEFAVNLSGGQRQRLAIARALLCDPQILLLDDPVAALDAETMREVVASLRSAARGRTTLMVTHCTPLLQQADRIVVLDGGRIVQQGSHASLSAVRGPYSQSLGLHLHSEPPPRSELRDQSA